MFQLNTMKQRDKKEKNNINLLTIYFRNQIIYPYLVIINQGYLLN